MASVQVAVELIGKDSASPAIATVQKGLAGLAAAAGSPLAAIGKLVTAFGSIGLAAAGIQAVAGAAAGLGQQMGVGLASQMESVSARFNAFTKDAAVTQQILGQVREEANRTPFAFAEMADAAAMLLPASKSAEGGLMGLTRQAEILAALNPAEGLKGAAFSLREALSGDFVSVMERFNIPRELINRLKAEGVPSAQIVSRALQEMGADMSLVGNLAATTEGRFSTFKDAIDGLRLVVGQPILAALGEQLDKMSGWLAANDAPLRAFAQTIGDVLAEGVRVGADAVGRLVEVLAPLGPVVETVASAALSAVRGDWVGAMGAMEQAAADTLDFIDNTFGTVGSVVADIGRAAMQAIRGDWSGAMALFQSAASAAAGVVGPILSNAVSTVQNAMSDFAPTGERLGRLFGTIGEAVEAVIPYLSGAASGLADVGEAAGGAEGLLDAVATAVNTVSGALETAVGWITQSQTNMTALGAVVGIVGAALTVQAASWAAASAAAAIARGALLATTAAQWLLNAALTANPIGIVVVAIGALIGGLVAAYNSNETFRNGVNAAWEFIKSSVIPAVAAVIAKISEINDFLHGYGPIVATTAKEIGTGIWQGIVAGIGAGLNFVRAKAVEIAEAAVTAAKNALGIASPSKEFEAIGEQTVEGFADGIDAEKAAAVAAVEGMLAEARRAADDASADTFGALTTTLEAQFGKQYTIVEEAQNRLGQMRNDVDKRYQRDLEVEETKFQRRVADLRESMGGKTVKQQEAINERLRQVEEDHNRKVEDLTEARGDRLIELEADNADVLLEATQRQALVRGEALRDLSRGMEDLEREVTEKSGEIAKKATDAANAAMEDAGRQTAEVIDKAAEQIQEAVDNLSLNRGIRARRDEFSAGQDAASLIFKQGREDADLLIRQAESVAERKRRLDESNADLERRRSREDADAEYDLARDLEDAKGDAERAQVQMRYDRTKADRDRRRKLDDDERDRKAKEDAAALDASFRKAQADLAKRRAADEVERDFRKQQQEQAQRFSDTLEDEALGRQIDRINEERDKRVTGIQQALTDKLQKIRENELAEQEELRKSYERKAADLKEKFLDKVGPMTAEGMNALSTYLQGITDRIGGVIDAATRAASAVAGIGGRVSGAGGATWANQPQAVRDMFGGDQAKWEQEHAAELAREEAASQIPQPTGFDPATGLPTGPGYYQPMPDTPYWRENMGRFAPLPFGTEYPEQAYSSSDPSSQDVFGGNNRSSIDEYAEGGVVPGGGGRRLLAYVHEGEGVFTPEQMSHLQIAPGGRGGGQGSTVEVHVHVGGSVVTEKELADKTLGHFRRQMRGQLNAAGWEQLLRGIGGYTP